MSDLNRFHTAQTTVFPTALAELRNGRKVSHWMWFIFPQLKSLGRSPTAQHYGIEGLEEARAYLADPVLKDRLMRVARAVLSHPDETAEAIMGPVDALKLRSSATLFREAGGGPEFQEILDTFYGGKPCPLTMDALARRKPESRS
jgi:uncharacterized protein (DUF1810 family)